MPNIGQPQAISVPATLHAGISVLDTVAGIARDHASS